MRTNCTWLNKHGFTILLAAISLLMVCPFVLQAAHEDITTTLTGYIVQRDAKGKETLVEASTAKPGDLVEYRLTLSNTTKVLIKNLEPTLPIPNDMELVEKSIKPDAQASLDGKTYAQIPLMRKVTDAKGHVKNTRIPFAEYRFLRWHLGDLPGGKDTTVKARARITAVKSTATTSASPR